MAKYLNHRGLGILDALEQVAHEVDASPVAVALAWQIAQPGITAPIASATSLQQLEELALAARLTLSQSQIALITDASAY